MSGQLTAQFLLVTGDNVQHATGQVGGIEHLVQVRGQQGVTLRGHQHHPVAHGQRRHNRGQQADQARFLRCDNANDTQWLAHGQGYVTHGRSVHLAVVFIGH